MRAAMVLAVVLAGCEEVETEYWTSTPSYVSITSGDSVTQTSQETLRVEGSCSDDAVVEWRNGDRSGRPPVRYEAFWLWGFYFAGTRWEADIPLAVGENTIVVRGTMPDGAWSEETLTVTYRPPVFEWVVPTYAFTPSLTIHGRVNPPAGVTVGAVVGVNLHASPDDFVAQGTLEWTVEVPIISGYNRIHVEAFDDLGGRIGGGSVELVGIAP